MRYGTWKGLKCRDCGNGHDIYMVKNQTWIQACPEDPCGGKIIEDSIPREGFFVCLKCVSTRLGRPLSESDFDFSVPCNIENEEIISAIAPK